MFLRKQNTCECAVNHEYKMLSETASYKKKGLDKIQIQKFNVLEGTTNNKLIEKQRYYQDLCNQEATNTVLTNSQIQEQPTVNTGWNIDV